MMWKRMCSIAGMLAISSGCLAAQQPTLVQAQPSPRVQPQAAPSGTVTGHVYCSDTQRAARFADVELLREVPANAQRAATTNAPGYQSIARGRTALDGSFSLGGVPVGDYYVMATATGYISPLAMARLAGKAISGLPMTHVEANRTSDAQVSMDRGAVISGRVTYDDGSPVAGVAMHLRPVDSVAGNSGRGFGFGGGFDFVSGFSDSGNTETDDRGVFRASGLGPGKYIVTATVQTETHRVAGFGGRGGFGAITSINVFAPGTMHKPDARVVEIRGGEIVDGVDIQVKLAGLHSIKGVLEAKSDSHALNSGNVSLVDAVDSSFSRSAAVMPDGTFQVEYLPPGNYTLTLNGTDRSTSGGGGRRDGPDTTKRYTPATKSVVVADGDVSVDAVLLDDAKSQ